MDLLLQPRPLTAILIAKDASRTLSECLTSLSFCQSIVLVDSGSTDNTVEIARSFGADVFNEADWEGFGIQKQRALSRVPQGWVLSIDCDEVVSDQLAQEIQAVLRDPLFQVYRMPRRNHLCGRAVYCAGWYPDFVVRLFKLGSATFNDNGVHESLQYQCPVGALKNDLLHYTYFSYEDAVGKINSYSSLAADYLAGRQHKLSCWSPSLRSLYRFFYCYVLRGGFIGGLDGFTVSYLQAFGVYLKYLKALS